MTYLGVGSDGLIDLEALRPGHHAADDPGQRDGRQQRDRRAAAARRDWRADARAPGPAAHRCGAGARQGSAERRRPPRSISASFSAHKMYGPQGVGALYVRSRHPTVRLAPLLDGGGHERGLRPGTLNAPGIVGFGAAAAICAAEMATEAVRLGALRDRLLAGLRAARRRACTSTGRSTRACRTICNVTIDGDGRDAGQSTRGAGGVVGLGVHHRPASSRRTCSARSACQRAAGTAALRFGLGRFSTDAEADAAVEHCRGDGRPPSPRAARRSIADRCRAGLCSGGGESVRRLRLARSEVLFVLDAAGEPLGLSRCIEGLGDDRREQPDRPRRAGSRSDRRRVDFVHQLVRSSAPCSLRTWLRTARSPPSSPGESVILRCAISTRWRRGRLDAAGQVAQPGVAVERRARRAAPWRSASRAALRPRRRFVVDVEIGIGHELLFGDGVEPRVEPLPGRAPTLRRCGPSDTRASSAARSAAIRAGSTRVALVDDDDVGFLELLAVDVEHLAREGARRPRPRARAAPAPDRPAR